MQVWGRIGELYGHDQDQLAINFQNFKMQDMSSVQWSRLAMQQQMLYYQNMQECLDLEEEIETLKTRIASKHKKHRRCDKEIEKENQCPFCEKKYASGIALKLHFKLKHQKASEERTWGCSTEEEHAQVDQLSPEPNAASKVLG